MKNVTTVFENEHRWEIEGEFDLNSSAAVIATRGTGYSVSKTATGEYTLTIPNSTALRVYEHLNSSANFTKAKAAGALGVYVKSITQSTTNLSDAITVVITTTAQATSGADTDVTGAITVSWRLVLRKQRMGTPFLE